MRRVWRALTGHIDGRGRVSDAEAPKEDPGAAKWPRPFKSPTGTVYLEYEDGRISCPVEDADIKESVRLHGECMSAINRGRAEQGLHAITWQEHLREEEERNKRAGMNWPD